jgi:Fur family ferric uptake transcriptional regulator
MTSDEAATAAHIHPHEAELEAELEAEAGQLRTHETYTVRLRRLGLRVTPQRLFVLEALEGAGGHLTAEEIMQWASRRYPALNLATVYRTLDLLVSVGLVAQTDLGGEATTYELVGDVPHHHLVCKGCGNVIEMDERLLESLRADALRGYGFHAQPQHLAIFGLCDQCYTATQRS